MLIFKTNELSDKIRDKPAKDLRIEVRARILGGSSAKKEEDFSGNSTIFF